MPDFYVYPAIFTCEEDGVSVEFPDLPGCVTCGDTVEEAYRMVQDALGGYLSVLVEDGDIIPNPMPMQAFHLEANQVVKEVLGLPKSA